MISKEIVERLRKGNWSIRCNTEQRVNWVLQACDDAKIKWALGQKATECFLSEPYPRIICFYKDYNGIIGDIDKTHEKYGVQDITDWFFNSILTPLPISREIWESVDKKWQYAAMNKDKEIYFFEHSPRLEVDGWVCYQLIDGFHRRLVSFLHSYGCYPADHVWDSYKSLTSCTICSFNINTDNIDWEYSLTCRPEGI